MVWVRALYRICITQWITMVMYIQLYFIVISISTPRSRPRRHGLVPTEPGWPSCCLTAHQNATQKIAVERSIKHKYGLIVRANMGPPKPRLRSQPAHDCQTFSATVSVPISPWYMWHHWLLVQDPQDCWGKRGVYIPNACAQGKPHVALQII